MEINGKKVVVIGGASGMGRASAELLAERGAEVVVPLGDVAEILTSLRPVVRAS